MEKESSSEFGDLEITRGLSELRTPNPHFPPGTIWFSTTGAHLYNNSWTNSSTRYGFLSNPNWKNVGSVAQFQKDWMNWSLQVQQEQRSKKKFKL